MHDGAPRSILHNALEWLPQTLATTHLTAEEIDARLCKEGGDASVIGSVVFCIRGPLTAKKKNFVVQADEEIIGDKHSRGHYGPMARWDHF